MSFIVDFPRCSPQIDAFTIRPLKQHLSLLNGLAAAPVHKNSLYSICNPSKIASVLHRNGIRVDAMVAASETSELSSIDDDESDTNDSNLTGDGMG